MFLTVSCMRAYGSPRPQAAPFCIKIRIGQTTVYRLRFPVQKSSLCFGAQHHTLVQSTVHVVSPLSLCEPCLHINPFLWPEVDNFDVLFFFFGLFAEVWRMIQFRDAGWGHGCSTGVLQGGSCVLIHAGSKQQLCDQLPANHKALESERVQHLTFWQSQVSSFLFLHVSPSLLHFHGLCFFWARLTYFEEHLVIWSSLTFVR